MSVQCYHLLSDHDTSRITGSSSVPREARPDPPGVSHLQQVSECTCQGLFQGHHDTLMVRGFQYHQVQAFSPSECIMSTSTNGIYPELKIREEQSTVITCSKLGRAQLH